MKVKANSRNVKLLWKRFKLFLSDPDVRLENKEYKTQKQCYMKNKTGKQ